MGHPPCRREIPLNDSPSPVDFFALLLFLYVGILMFSYAVDVVGHKPRAPAQVKVKNVVMAVKYI